MVTLIGVLADVSGSMKENFVARPNKKNGDNWARSIFNVVDSLIKHDVSPANHVFALGFGACKEPQVFDLLSTVEKNSKPLPPSYRNKTKYELVEEFFKMIKPSPSWLNLDNLKKVMTKYDACVCLEEFKTNDNARKMLMESINYNRRFSYLSPVEKAKETVRLAKTPLTRKIIEQILTILENNGAPRVRTWASMEVLLEEIEMSQACTFLEECEDSSEFRKRFVLDCLPEKCRGIEFDAKSFIFEGLNLLAKQFPRAQEYATRDSVKEVVAKGKELMSKFKIVELVPIEQEAIMNVQKASEILHGGIVEDDFADERVDELMDTVEPVIYGRTPLMTTINLAKKLFSTLEFKDHSKLLFIISDGQPTDGNDPPIEELCQLGVTTVCCYITQDRINNPKHLYSTECETWDEAAKLMFAMSSTISTQEIPRTFFVERGWSIDITNNETRLFAQVNHPDIIEDVCDFARNVVCSQDSLSDLLATVSLDLYINQANQGFNPKRQIGGTCYANASAAVLHLSMKRIHEREGGYPAFFELREKMIQKYGPDGANILSVLKEFCPEYRLHYEEVDILGALRAVTAKRPVLAWFWLTDSEWHIFSAFYEQNPQGVLTSAILDVKRRPRGSKPEGHAVVLTSFNSEGLRLMNSWGSDWADGGFFKIANADVLGLKFVDVFWTLEDLTQSEIIAYNRYGPSIAQEMFSKLQGLQKMKYCCPKCRKNSNVNEFSGNHLKAECPKCHRKFNIKEAGDGLALNMYLLSLTNREENRLTCNESIMRDGCIIN